MFSWCILCMTMVLVLPQALTVTSVRQASLGLVSIWPFMCCWNTCSARFTINSGVQALWENCYGCLDLLLCRCMFLLCFVAAQLMIEVAVDMIIMRLHWILWPCDSCQFLCEWENRWIGIVSWVKGLAVVHWNSFACVTSSVSMHYDNLNNSLELHVSSNMIDCLQAYWCGCCNNEVYANGDCFYTSHPKLLKIGSVLVTN